MLAFRKKISFTWETQSTNNLKNKTKEKIRRWIFCKWKGDQEMERRVGREGGNKILEMCYLYVLISHSECNNCIP